MGKINMNKLFFILLFINGVLFGQDTISSFINSDIARLYINPTIGQQVIKGHLPKNGKVLIIDEVAGYWEVIYNNKNGYIDKDFIESNNELNEFHYNSTGGKYGLKSDEIKKKFGKRIAYKIFAGEVWIGMTHDMALHSKGLPKDVISTVTKNKITEQWLYNHLILYFQDGKLTKWQTSANSY